MPKPKPKKTKGRPTAFSVKRKDAIKLMSLRGFTDAEMAFCIGVTEQTLNNWKKKHPDFFESLKDWKAVADQSVEKSLYERATGYTCPETKPQWIFDKEEDAGGRWEYAEFNKHYPPDPTSMIFWLKNRQPDKWRDKVDHEHAGDITLRVVYDDAKEPDAND